MRASFLRGLAGSASHSRGNAENAGFTRATSRAPGTSIPPRSRFGVLRGFGAACPGDTNGDDVIDFLDLNAVVSAYNTVAADPGYNPGADVDADGDVDFADLNVVVSAFNSAC